MAGLFQEDDGISFLLKSVGKKADAGGTKASAGGQTKADAPPKKSSGFKFGLDDDGDDDIFGEFSVGGLDDDLPPPPPPKKASAVAELSEGGMSKDEMSDLAAGDGDGMTADGNQNAGEGCEDDLVTQDDMDYQQGNPDNYEGTTTSNMGDPCVSEVEVHSQMMNDGQPDGAEPTELQAPSSDSPENAPEDLQMQDEMIPEDQGAEDQMQPDDDGAEDQMIHDNGSAENGGIDAGNLGVGTEQGAEYGFGEGQENLETIQEEVLQEEAAVSGAEQESGQGQPDSRFITFRSHSPQAEYQTGHDDMLPDDAQESLSGRPSNASDMNHSGLQEQDAEAMANNRGSDHANSPQNTLPGSDGRRDSAGTNVQRRYSNGRASLGTTVEPVVVVSPNSKTDRIYQGRSSLGRSNLGRSSLGRASLGFQPENQPSGPAPTETGTETPQSPSDSAPVPSSETLTSAQPAAETKSQPSGPAAEQPKRASLPSSNNGTSNDTNGAAGVGNGLSNSRVISPFFKPKTPNQPAQKNNDTSATASAGTAAPAADGHNTAGSAVASVPQPNFDKPQSNHARPQSIPAGEPQPNAVGKPRLNPAGRPKPNPAKPQSTQQATPTQQPSKLNPNLTSVHQSKLTPPNNPAPAAAAVAAPAAAAPAPAATAIASSTAHRATLLSSSQGTAPAGALKPPASKPGTKLGSASPASLPRPGLLRPHQTSKPFLSKLKPAMPLGSTVQQKDARALATAKGAVTTKLTDRRPAEKKPADISQGAAAAACSTGGSAVTNDVATASGMTATTTSVGVPTSETQMQSDQPADSDHPPASSMHALSDGQGIHATAAQTQRTPATPQNAGSLPSGVSSGLRGEQQQPGAMAHGAPAGNTTQQAVAITPARSNATAARASNRSEAAGAAAPAKNGSDAVGAAAPVTTGPESAVMQNPPAPQSRTGTQAALRGGTGLLSRMSGGAVLRRSGTLTQSMAQSRSAAVATGNDGVDPVTLTQHHLHADGGQGLAAQRDMASFEIQGSQVLEATEEEPSKEMGVVEATIRAGQLSLPSQALTAVNGVTAAASGALSLAQRRSGSERTSGFATSAFNSNQIVTTFQPTSVEDMDMMLTTSNFVKHEDTLDQMMMEIKTMREKVLNLRITMAVGSNKLTRANNPILLARLKGLKRKAEEACIR